MLPAYFWSIVVVVFGLIIGSFLNVVIYRLHTGRSLNDRSHCLSCGRPLRWYELFPVVSFVALLGRCRACGSYIPYRYAAVEALTAAAFVLAYHTAADAIEFVLLCVLVSILIVGLVYDIYHLIIPDEVSYGAAAVAALLVAYGAIVGEGWPSASAAASAALAAFALFASLWYFSRGRAFGFGDAKLSLSLAALCGWPGVFSFIALSFWLGAVVSAAVVAIRAVRLHIRRGGGLDLRARMKSEVPFAPFLILSFALVYFFNADVLAFIETIFIGV